MASEPEPEPVALTWSGLKTHLELSYARYERQDTYEMAVAQIDEAARQLDDAIAAALLAAEQRGRDAERDTNPAREIIEQIVSGTAPLSRWMGSVDCKTYDDLEWYLQTQLRDKLYLKSAMEKSGDPDNVRDFVDGGIAAIEGMLQTLRNVAAAIRKGDAPT